MSARDRHTLQTEPTPQGEQTLIPDVQPPRATAPPFWPTQWRRLGISWRMTGLDRCHLSRFRLD
ncbi:hypothetical protein [Mesorhizobium sp. LjNodule214]|uniref:hypothetical protein n=1 Tax=Mesorhizobium sp. LjNodule214 TaxID=3342252 RepID=UPI003ECE6943